MTNELLTMIECEVKSWPAVTTGDTGSGGLQFRIAGQLRSGGAGAPAREQLRRPAFPEEGPRPAHSGRTGVGASAALFVTAEYNHGVPGVLKYALDHVSPECNRKPAALVGYGGVGVVRAVEQLRLVSSSRWPRPARPCT